MVHFSCMSRKAAALAATFVAGLQVAAAAQVDITWNSFPELQRPPAYFRPGDPLPEFTPGSLNLRPAMAFEESEEDRERRQEVLSRCALLGSVRGLSILDVVV